MFFSYASDELDWQIKCGQPAKSEIEDCMAEVWARIEDCRAQWWRDLKKLCLDNKQVELNGAILRTVPPQKSVKTAKPTMPARGPKGKAKMVKSVISPAVLTVKPKSATYDPATKSVEFTALGSDVIHTGKCP